MTLNIIKEEVPVIDAIEAMHFVLDNMRPSDWDQVFSVYEEGIAIGHATSEVKAPAWEEWDTGHLPRPRLVARVGDCIVGWAALSPVFGRCVYAGVAEISLYVGAKHRGQGVGSALLAALIEASEAAGIWTLQGGIFPENAASLALVKKHGFREVGRRERLGKMTYGDLAGAWRDVILVERRSSVTGLK